MRIWFSCLIKFVGKLVEMCKSSHLLLIFKFDSKGQLLRNLCQYQLVLGTIVYLVIYHLLCCFQSLLLNLDMHADQFCLLFRFCTLTCILLKKLPDDDNSMLIYSLNVLLIPIMIIMYFQQLHFVLVTDRLQVYAKKTFLILFSFHLNPLVSFPLLMEDWG